MDALNTQVDTIKAILKKANCVLPVKENKKLTYDEIKDYFGNKELLERVKIH